MKSYPMARRFMAVSGAVFLLLYLLFTGFLYAETADWVSLEILGQCYDTASSKAQRLQDNLVNLTVAYEGDEELQLAWREYYLAQAAASGIEAYGILRVKLSEEGWSYETEEVLQRSGQTIYCSYKDEQGNNRPCVIRLSEYLTVDELAELQTILYCDLGASRVDDLDAAYRMTGVWIRPGVMAPIRLERLQPGGKEWTPLYEANTPPAGEAVTIEAEGEHWFLPGFVTGDLWAAMAASDWSYPATDEGRQIYKSSFYDSWEEKQSLLSGLEAIMDDAWQYGSPVSFRGLGKQTYIYDQYVTDAVTSGSTLAVVYYREIWPLREVLPEIWKQLVIGLAAAALGWALLSLLVWRKIAKPLRSICADNGKGYAPGFTPSNVREINLVRDQFVAYRGKEKEQEVREAALRQAVSHAEDAERLRRENNSAVAHELKTPLAIIHSYAEALQEDIAEEKRERYLEVILTEAERMDALVMEMLDLSRLEAGKTVLRKEDFFLEELVQNVFRRLELALSAKEISLEWYHAERVQVCADISRMEQVVLNIASNALRHTPIGGTIRIRINRGYAGRGSLRIENDGQRLGTEELAHIWDTFYMADASREKQGGSGLGLAIVREIVRLHGGTYTAHNTENGVEFGVEI